MPYNTVADLPEAQVRKYSPNQRKAFLDVWNSAHDRGLSEADCFREAHHAAKGARKKIRVKGRPA
jgi:cation transport regulator ChaB